MAIAIKSLLLVLSDTIYVIFHQVVGKPPTGSSDFNVKVVAGWSSFLPLVKGRKKRNIDYEGKQVLLSHG